MCFNDFARWKKMNDNLRKHLQFMRLCASIRNPFVDVIPPKPGTLTIPNGELVAYPSRPRQGYGHDWCKDSGNSNNPLNLPDEDDYIL
jgi:hypothetical protein